MKRPRLWLGIGIALAGAAVVLLWPTVDWYLRATPAQRNAASGSLRGMNAYVQAKTGEDLAALVAMDAADAIPREFRYLVPLAAGHLRKSTRPPPTSGRLGDLFSGYPDRSLLASDIAEHHWARLESLRDRYWRVLRFGRDGGGGSVRLVVKADFEDFARSTGKAPDSTERQRLLTQASGVLEARLRDLSRGTPVVRRMADDRILLSIPGTRDLERARSIATTQGRITFNIADTDSLAVVRELLRAGGGSPLDEEGNVVDPALLGLLPRGSVIRGVYQLDRHGQEKLAGYAVVSEKPGLDGTEIRDAVVGRDQLTRQPTINFILSPEGGETFYRLTSSSIGRVLAILYDGRIRAQATIRTPIRDMVQVAGFSEDEARAIGLMLRTGSLPVRLEVVEAQVMERTTQ